MGECALLKVVTMFAPFVFAPRLSIPLLLFTAISPARGVERERIDRLVAPYLEKNIPTLAGAGAVRSTVDDMLSFLAAQLDPPEGTLGKAIDQAWQIHWRPEKTGHLSIGLGWHVAHDGQTRWHNGGTGGYHSMMLANRDKNVAVILLCNTATREIDRLGEDLINTLAAVPVQPHKFP